MFRGSGFMAGFLLTMLWSGGHERVAISIMQQ